MMRSAGISALLLLLGACDPEVTRPDSGPGRDAGGAEERDAGGRRDSGPSGTDAGPGDDAGAPDDAGMPMDGAADTDAGSSGTDAGMSTCATLPTSGSVTLNGTIEMSDPTFDRPIASGTCPATSTLGPSHYDTFTFCPAASAGDYRIQLDAAASMGLTDPYLIVYDGAMVPTDPLMCLAGDDDDGTGNNSEIPTLSVTMGQTITIVPCGFDDMDLGAYDLTITRL